MAEAGILRPSPDLQDPVAPPPFDLDPDTGQPVFLSERQRPDPVRFEPGLFNPAFTGAEGAEDLVRTLGLGTIPARTAGISASIEDFLPQVQGSTAEIQGAVGPQIRQIQGTLSEMFDAISKRLGRFGGGQVERVQQEALTDAGGQVQQLFAQQPAIALRQLLARLNAVTPLVSVSPPLNTVTQQAPLDVQGLGAGAASIIDTLQALFASQGGTPFAPAQLALSPSPAFGGGTTAFPPTPS